MSSRIKDFFQKRFNSEEFEEKNKVTSGLEDLDFDLKEHTEVFMKSVKDNLLKFDKLTVSRQLLVFLTVLRNYRKLAPFGGDRAIIN